MDEFLEYEPRFVRGGIALGDWRDDFNETGVGIAPTIGILANRTEDAVSHVTELASKVEELTYKMERLRQVVVCSLDAIREEVKEESLAVGDDTRLEDFLGQFIGEVKSWT